MAAGGDSQQHFTQLRQSFGFISPCNQPPQPRPAMQPDRGVGKQTGAQRQAILLIQLGQILHLNQGHVHRVFAFPLTAFATHAQIHGPTQHWVRKGLIAQFSVQRSLQQTHPPTRGQVAFTGHTVARAHHTLVVVAFASLAVDADRHGLGKIAACLGDVGIGIAHASVLVGRPVEKGFHKSSRDCSIRFGAARSLPALTEYRVGQIQRVKFGEIKICFHVLSAIRHSGA